VRFLTGSGCWRDTYLNGRGSIPYASVAHIEGSSRQGGATAAVRCESRAALSAQQGGLDLRSVADQVNDARSAASLNIRDESDRDRVNARGGERCAPPTAIREKGGWASCSAAPPCRAISAAILFGPGWWTRPTAPAQPAPAAPGTFWISGAPDHSPHPPRAKRTEDPPRGGRSFEIRALDSLTE